MCVAFFLHKTKAILLFSPCIKSWLSFCSMGLCLDFCIFRVVPYGGGGVSCVWYWWSSSGASEVLLFNYAKSWTLSSENNMKSCYCRVRETEKLILSHWLRFNSMCLSYQGWHGWWSNIYQRPPMPSRPWAISLSWRSVFQSLHNEAWRGLPQQGCIPPPVRLQSTLWSSWRTAKGTWQGQW